jgi:DNA polymerase-3 subunit chi
VFGPAPLLARLDQALWTQDELEFLPHLRLRANAPVADAARERTALWLLDQADASLRCDSAVNLGSDEVEMIVSHARIAEIVASGPDERSAGQQRWKRYKALGHTLLHRPQDTPSA